MRRAAAGLVLACCAAGAAADTGTASAVLSTATLNASASLDFILNIGHFIFFSVGPGTYPAVDSSISSVSIAMQPSIPGVPTLPTTTANNVSVNWNGAALSFTPTPASMTVPVQVRSNAGQISIRASVATPLTSGADTIPLSQIQVSSSDANLPAPAIPDTGTGASVNVTGTAFGNLVTSRDANWTFSYNPAVLPAPGTYNGQISFTAVSP